MCLKSCVVCCLSLLLLSCSSTLSVSHSALDNVENSITALEKSLPSNCKTEDITARINTIRNEITTVRAGVEAELKAEQETAVRWRWAFWCLVVTICAFIVGKVFI